MKNTSTKKVQGRGRPAKYKFASLKVGGFLLAPLKNRNNVVTSAYLFAKRHGQKFASEQLEKTVRIRRVA